MNQKGLINIVLIILVVMLVSYVIYFILARRITSPILPIFKTSPSPTLQSTNSTNWDTNKEYFYYYVDEANVKRAIPIRFAGIKNGYPHFISQGSTKAEVLLTDEFIVKIKTGETREDLEILNRKYNVSIVVNMYGTKDQFILTVKNSPSSNALDMANFYQNQEIVEWAAPNFMQLSAGPN